MSINSTSPNRTLPLAATSVVVGGKSTSGFYDYTSTLPAGNYVVSAVSLDDSSYSSSFYVWNSATDAKTTITNGGNSYFTIATDATSVQFRPTVAVPTTWTQRTNFFSGGSGGKNFRYFSETGVSAYCNSSIYYTTDTSFTKWNVTTPPNGGLDLAYGAGRYVSVGGSTSLAHSTDLATWTSIDLESTITYGGSLNSVVYRNGLFVAVGNRATIATSTDGLTWITRRRGLVVGNIIAGFYYDNKFVYMPQFSNVVYNISTDFTYWTQPALTNSYTPQTNAYYVGADEVLIGESSGRYLRTTDLVTWTESQIGSSTFSVTGMTKVDNTYIACGSSGNIWYSTDLTNWTQATASFGTSTVNEVAYGAGIYVAVGAGGRLTSTTDLATTWTARTSGFGTSSINDVEYGNGIFLAVGNGGRVATSTDGITWSGRATAATSTLQNAYWDGTYWVCGGATSQYSTDGVTWSSMGTLGINSTANGIFKQGANWYAYGQTTIQRSFSTDLSTWTPLSVGLYDATPLWAVEYANDRWAVGGGVTNATAIATSTDTITWDNQVASTTNIGFGSAAVNPTTGAIVFAGGQNTTGSHTTYARSTDNITWGNYNLSSQMDSAITGVAFGGGYIAFFGNGGGSLNRNFVLTTDFSAFSSYYQSTPAAVLYSGVYVNDSFVVTNASSTALLQIMTPASPTYNVLGMYYGSVASPNYNSLSTSGQGAIVFPLLNGDFYYSTNGINWSQRRTGQNLNYYACAYGNGAFVFGSSNGNVIRSTDLTTFASAGSGYSQVNAIAFSSKFNRFYLANTSTTSLVFSTTGTSWSGNLVGDLSANPPRSIATGEKIVVVNQSSTVRTSEDGSTFSSATVGTANWNCATYGNNTYVIFSGVTNVMFSSTDAVTWTNRTVPTTNVQSVRFLGGLFYASTYSGPSDTTIYTSTDAITWTLRYTLNGYYTSSITELNGTVVALVTPSSNAGYNPILVQGSPANTTAAYYLYRSNLGELA